MTTDAHNDTHHGHEHAHQHDNNNDHHASSSHRSSSTTKKNHCSNNNNNTNNDRLRLQLAMVLCAIFFVVECVGGVLSGSLAILSDAAHLFSDLAALAVALAATTLAASPPTAYHTYGFQRIESLAALVSMLTLVLVCIYLAGQAVLRGYHLMSATTTTGAGAAVVAYEIDGPLMSGIAAIGVVVNILLAIVLGGDHVHLPGSSHDHDHSHHHHDHGAEESCAGEHDHHHHHSAATTTSTNTTEGNCNSHNHDGHDHAHTTCDPERQQHPTETSGLLSNNNKEVDVSDCPTPPKKRNVNLHAAYLHVLGDLLQSLAVLLTGLVVWWNPAYGWIDPVITLLFCLLVIHSTVGVVRSSLSVLLDAVPHTVDWRQLHQDCVALPSVASIHDLHIWSVADGVTAATIHAVAVDTNDIGPALCALQHVCKHQHGIHHLTVQVQPAHMPDCVTCCDTTTSTAATTTTTSHHRCVVYTEEEEEEEEER